MNRTIIIAAAVIVILIALAGMVRAEPSSDLCGESAKAFRRVLVEKYGEERIGFGLSAYGGLTEIWANHVTGTWTVLIIQTDDSVCIADQGEAWTSSIQPKGDPA